MTTARGIRGICLVATLAASIAVAAGVNAATPTPTSMAAPPAPAVFGGSAWVNSHPVGDQDVAAKIGSTTCALEKAPFITPPDTNAPVYSLSVPSEDAVPGCGHDGALITFFVGTQQAPQTAVWHAGEDEHIDLIIGPSFALFTGAPGSARLPAGEVIVPYVGNVQCGYASLNNTRDNYGAVVYSTDQQASCGTGGNSVTFKLLDAQGNVVAVANQTGVWHAWDGVSAPQQLNLTFAPVGGSGASLPNTGDGSPEASLLTGLALLLGSLGLVGTAFGLAFRRRATKY